MSPASSWVIECYRHEAVVSVRSGVIMASGCGASCGHTLMRGGGERICTGLVKVRETH